MGNPLPLPGHDHELGLQSAPAGPGGTAARSHPAVTAGCYAVLLLLGIAEGVIGAFQYSRGIGAFPAAAIGFALLVLLTCVLASWGMRTPSGGLMAAVGWFVAALVLAMTTPGGSIVITNAASGKWFLFGGAACAAAGVVTGFAKWPSARKARQQRPPLRKPSR